MTDSSRSAEHAPDADLVEALVTAALDLLHHDRSEESDATKYNQRTLAKRFAKILSTRADTTRQEWRPLEDADKTRPNLVGAWPSSIRWKTYKPGAPAWALHVGGRWQRTRGEYGGWENCDPPMMVRSLPLSQD